jgi:hypothetical protein
MSDETTRNPAAELVRAIHGDCLANPPSGEKLRQADSQAKPWLGFGISRATWYRIGKPTCESEFSGCYYRRQRNRADAEECSVRSIQRREFARRYGISEICSLATHHCLPPAMLEEVAKWEHDNQRRFADRLRALAADLPKRYEPNDHMRRTFSSFEIVVFPASRLALRRAARRALKECLPWT